MSKKQTYKESNETFLEELRKENDILSLPGGILYRIVTSGNSERSPLPNSIVTVHYQGRLINGRIFDDSRKRPCPEAFRLTEVIKGWQIALRHMQVGDRWTLYIPASLGYGSRTSGPIPGNSTLIFDVELIGIA